MRRVHRKTLMRQPVETKNPDPQVGLTAGEAQLRLSRGWDNRVTDKAARTEGRIQCHLTKASP